MPARILCVAGARPNFIKIAPIVRALGARPGLEPRLVHTGQHFDDKLSRVFFDHLGIPRPDVELSVGSASHAQQTAEIMRRFEPVLATEQPQGVLVVGDVNSTIACALVASKFHLREGFRCSLGVRTRPVVIHVEAGLRSRDDDMPEEINRRLTDAISDLLFVSEPAGVENLRKEGVSAARFHLVGNVMIDTLLAAKERALASPVLEELQVSPGAYGLVTLHRPSNVDDPGSLRALLSHSTRSRAGCRSSFRCTRERGRRCRRPTRLSTRRAGASWIRWYFKFLRLMSAAGSYDRPGGIQEETPVLGVPCVTLRENAGAPCDDRRGDEPAGRHVRRGSGGVPDAVGHDQSRPRRGRGHGHAAERVAAVLGEFLPSSAPSPRSVAAPRTLRYG